MKNTKQWTDELPDYKGVTKELKTKYEYVVHSEKKYAIKEIDHEAGEVITISTNGIENIWSVVKRELKGIYIRPNLKYMQEYLNEFQFRYNHKNIFIEMVKRIFSNNSNIFYN